MYTLLLMTAMSSGPQTAEFNGFFRDLFSFGGCNGSSCRGSCSGSCYGSCSGASSGCYGSSNCNGFGSRLRAFFSGSCYGSCSGRSSGCSGSCHGSCNGSGYGCNGGFAPVPMGPGEYAPLPAGATAPGLDYIPATPVPAVPPASVPEDRRRISLTGAGNRATVIVRLPADAKLFAEGRLLTLTSAERTFVTPPLQTGPDYSYTFRAEYLRDGETIARSKTVAVKPGATVTVEFADGLAKAEPVRKPDPVPAKPTAAPKVAPSVPSALDRARITVKLPPGATLYVDGKRNERTEPVREFNTPPLPAGQEFAYLMKAEVLRDGRPETTTTKVSFRAGEIVTVDLTTPTK